MSAFYWMDGGPWRLHAPERRRLPSWETPAADSAACPLCTALDEDSLYTIARVGEARALVPPRPLLAVETPLSFGAGPLLRRASGTGAQELLVEGLEHQPRLELRGVEAVTDVIALICARLGDLHDDRRFRYVFWSRDEGRGLGAIGHGHGQILAQTLVPPAQLERIAAGWRHHRVHHRVRTLDEIEVARRAGRVLWEEEPGLVAWLPASGVDFEVHLSASHHQPWFDALDAAHRAALARLWCRTLAALRSALGPCPMSSWIDTCPNPQAFPGEREAAILGDQDPAAITQWRLVIRPELRPPAAWEVASGVCEAHLAPARVAAWLRDATPLES